MCCVVVYRLRYLRRADHSFRGIQSCVCMFVIKKHRRGRPNVHPGLYAPLSEWIRATDPTGFVCDILDLVKACKLFLLGHWFWQNVFLHKSSFITVDNHREFQNSYNSSFWIEPIKSTLIFNRLSLSRPPAPCHVTFPHPLSTAQSTETCAQPYPYSPDICEVTPLLYTYCRPLKCSEAIHCLPYVSSVLTSSVQQFLRHHTTVYRVLFLTLFKLDIPVLNLR
jgi:hypothetical protein